MLSPILFGVYMDELVLSLQACGQGCHIGQIFMEEFTYADDASLLAPSKKASPKVHVRFGKAVLRSI
jgi:hypothetical protein